MEEGMHGRWHRGPPGWRHHWGLHEARYTGIPLHIPGVAAALHIAAAVAALASAYIVFRGYAASRDRGLLATGSGLLLVALASLVESTLYMGVLGPEGIVVADGLYVAGYALILWPGVAAAGEAALALGLIGAAHILGSAAAGVLALALSMTTTPSVGVAFLILAASHFIDSVMTGLGLYTPALAISAALLRIIGLNVLLLVLLVPAARKVRRGEEET